MPANLSVTDSISAELIAAGYGPGSVQDMEYKRLLITTGATAKGHTLMDLYALAGEHPGRLT